MNPATLQQPKRKMSSQHLSMPAMQMLMMAVTAMAAPSAGLMQ